MFVTLAEAWAGLDVPLDSADSPRLRASPTNAWSLRRRLAMAGEAALAPDVRMLGDDRAVGVDVVLEPVDLGGEPFDLVVGAAGRLFAMQGPDGGGEAVDDGAEVAGGGGGGREEQAGRGDDGGPCGDRETAGSHRLQSLRCVTTLPLLWGHH
jgi:hypothetical protein